MSINPAFTRVTGYAPSEVIGRPLSDLLVGEARAALSDTGRSGNEVGFGIAPLEAQLASKDGELIWTEMLATPEHDANGALLGYHRICRNITERKQMEDQVRQLAFYDPLTQLANRRLLNDRLEQAMTASKRSGRFGALLFLDLDNFKPLNDAYGHGVGDLLLREVADRLRSCVRQIDTVARFGGDEFVVMLSALGTDRAASVMQARAVAEKVRATLAQPYRLSFRHAERGDLRVDHQSAASIGVALFFGHQAAQEDIVKWADTAMYEAKQAGRNRVCFHEPPFSSPPPAAEIT
ncbi:MAG: sensor domain-containing diguanylate cyclase, partial [Propionivibrio sp.]